MITMANDQYLPSSLDNEIDLTQQMPSANPASKKVKEHPTEYFHVNSGARFDMPMRQIVAPGSDDGPDLTQPNDSTQINDITQPDGKTPLNNPPLVPVNHLTNMPVKSPDILFHSPVHFDPTQAVDGTQPLNNSSPSLNPSNFTQAMSPFKIAIKPLQHVYSSKARTRKNGLRQSAAQQTSPKLDPLLEKLQTNENTLHSNKDYNTNLDDIPETQVINTQSQALQPHEYLADTTDLPQTPSFRERCVKTPRKRVNFPTLVCDDEEKIMSSAAEITTQLVQTESPVGPQLVLHNLAATQPIQSQSQVQVPSTPTEAETQVVQDHVPGTQIIPATQAVQSQTSQIIKSQPPSTQLIQSQTAATQIVPSQVATQMIQNHASTTQLIFSGESPATQIIHAQSPRVGQLANANDSPYSSNVPKDLFLTPKPYLQPSKSPYNNNLNSSPINDTQPLSSNSPVTPTDRKRLSLVAEESEKDTQSTVDSHIRPFREVEETQAASERIRNFPRFDSPSIPSIDDDEVEKPNFSQPKPASQLLDYSSQLSNVEIPGTAEQKDNGSSDPNPDGVNGVVSSSEIMNSSASHMINIYDYEKQTDTIKQAFTSEDDNDEVITSDYENEETKTNQSPTLDHPDSELLADKNAHFEKEPIQSLEPVSSPLAKKNERFKRRIVMDDEDATEANIVSKRQRSNNAFPNLQLQSNRKSLRTFTTPEDLAWPEWGTNENIGEKGVWVQWGNQVLVGSLMTGGQQESNWNALLSRSNVSNLLDTDSLPDLSVDGSRPVDVTFYDSKVGVAPLDKLKALELERGDLVKVNYNRKVVFEVVDFLNTSRMTKDQIQNQVDSIAREATGNEDIKGTVVSPNPETVRIRDVYGHDYIIVKTHIASSIKQTKSTRRSRMTTRPSTSLTQDSGNFYAVMLCDLYMPNSQWRVYLSRRNNLRNDVAADLIKRDVSNKRISVSSTVATIMEPMIDMAQRVRDKDGRRKSTMVQDGAYYESPVEEENLDEFKFSKYSKDDNKRGLTPTRKGKQSSSLFSGCVFSLTKLADESKWANAITSHGGVVLRDGFQQLLKFDNNSETGPLVFNSRSTAGGEEFHFAAVLSMEPLRTLKYLEALALGWPCLSWHFIADCLEDADCLIQWESYVLSAGTSKCLGNVPVACSLNTFWTLWQSHAPLSTQFQSHRKIFECIRVPIVMIEHERISELVTTGSWDAIKPSSNLPSTIAGSGKKKAESSYNGKHGIVIKPRSKEAVSLSRTLRLIIIIMGADPQLLTIIKDLKDISKLQAVLGNCVVIHNCEGVGTGRPGRHTTTVSSIGTAGSTSLGGEWEMTEDKKVLRLLRSSSESLGRTVEYQKEWIVQCLINGRVV